MGRQITGPAELIIGGSLASTEITSESRENQAATLGGPSR
jgi:hypothetical protein